MRSTAEISLDGPVNRLAFEAQGGEFQLPRGYVL